VSDVSYRKDKSDYCKTGKIAFFNQTAVFKAKQLFEIRLQRTSYLEESGGELGESELRDVLLIFEIRDG